MKNAKEFGWLVEYGDFESIFEGDESQFLILLDKERSNGVGGVYSSLNAFTLSLLFVSNSLEPRNIRFTIDGRPVHWCFQLFFQKEKYCLIQGSSFGEKFITKTTLSRRFLLVGGNMQSNTASVAKVQLSGHFAIGDYSEIRPSNWEECVERISLLIQRERIDTVLLCLGQPKQEHLGVSLKSRIPGIQIICLGAFIDFYAGSIERSPILLQRVGLEWLWRLLFEPKRLWKRYLIQSPLGLLFLITKMFKAVVLKL